MKIIITSILLAALCASATLSAQVKPDKGWWYFITLQSVQNKQTELTEYRIRPSGGGFFSGTEEAFKRQLWGKRSNDRLAVGPFWDRNQAALSQRLYGQVARNITRETTEVISGENEVHWYFLKVQIKRSGFLLEPTAARVATGSLQEFYDSLKEGLYQELLAVGPFADYTEAEDSKALYRTQEKSGRM